MLCGNLLLPSSASPWGRVVFLHRSNGGVSTTVRGAEREGPLDDPFGLEQPFADKFARPKFRCTGLYT